MKRIFTIAILAFTISAIAQSQGGVTLSADPSAEPDNVCSGQTVRLYTLVDGGTNNLTYSWTSDPPGFSSNYAEPYVTPLVTTVYTVTVSDGLTSATGNVTVTVNPLPNIDLLPADDPNIRVISNSEFSICAFESITLDAGNPGSLYYWSNGSSEQTIIAASSGLSFDLQEHQVTVTNPVTGCSSSSSISVFFNFSDCSYGFEENSGKELVQLYPNPSTNGIFNYAFEGLKGEVILEVYTCQGTLAYHNIISTNGNPYKSILNLSSQTSGIYFLKVTSNDLILARKLIIKH